MLVDAIHFDRSPRGLAALARTVRLFPGEGAIDLAGLLVSLPGDVPISVEVPSLWSRGRTSAEIAAHAFATARAVLGSLTPAG